MSSPVMRTATSPRVEGFYLRLFAGSIGKHLEVNQFPNQQTLKQRFLLRPVSHRQATVCPELASCYLSIRMTQQ